MNKYVYLGKNIGLLTISSFGTKLLSFFLVPLYTNILTTTQYGTYDLFATTISLLIPILTINIHDSVLRFALDNTQEQKVVVFNSGLRLVFLSSVFVAFFTIINQHLEIIKFIIEYPVFFVALYITTAFYQLISNYARGLEKIREVSISGIISALTGLVLNIILLIYAGMGLDGYFIASIASSLFPFLYLSIVLQVYKRITFTHNDTKICKEMYAYSIPLVLNTIGWWLNSTSNRYIITALCGVAANGIFAVGYKIPSILNVFQSIFNQAWVLSSVKEYDPDDTDGFFSLTYNLYNALLVIICSFIIGLNKIIAKYLYLKDFYIAWQYVPYLTIAIIFGALSGHIGGVFSAAKDSKIFALSTVIGAGVNVILTFFLVRNIGPIGAALATAISYYLVWLIRLFCVKKYMVLKLNFARDHVAYVCLLILSAVVHFLDDDFFKYSIVILFWIGFLYLFRIEVGKVVYKFNSMI